MACAVRIFDTLNQNLLYIKSLLSHTSYIISISISWTTQTATRIKKQPRTVYYSSEDDGEATKKNEDYYSSEDDGEATKKNEDYYSDGGEDEGGAKSSDPEERAEKETYDEVFEYLTKGTYPQHATKRDKSVLRRKATSFQVVEGILHYKGKKGELRQV